jgi:hypothetical protein
MFTSQDIEQFKSIGVEVATVEKQLKYFKDGFPYLPLAKAATIGDGILSLDKNKADEYEKYYSEKSGDLSIVKFVPASGAATRMFKSLFSFINDYKGTESDYTKFVEDKSFQSIYHFFKNLEDFAFYEDLKITFTNLYGQDLSKAIELKEFVPVLEALLNQGLHYGELPKGLLKFHKYPQGISRTPVEEHMVEAAVYGVDKNRIANLHFTVSPEHKSRFEELIAEVKGNYENIYNVNYHISFSEQKKSTDTIAVDPQNEPFREKDNSILFRPAGHGALIYNLNEINSDLIFIKNIDNVVPDKIKEETFRYKKIIAGVLLSYRTRVFDLLQKLYSSEFEKAYSEAEHFLRKELCIDFPEINGTEAREFYIQKLNRPIRVCGMVQNVGEPGGGPFWAKNPDGTTSLQIVESAQIDMNNKDQKTLFNSATHFNPVDLVCAVKDMNGKKFDLGNFVDHSTGFVSQKSKDGKDLQAQELPGLWNGSMADWITIFVEVPIITFNPVKTVNDLLREEHQ